jgi:hypothetical protein
VKERETAALNVSILAAYEMYYGTVPRELVEFVHHGVSRLDFFTPPESVIKLAKARALYWLAEQLEKENNNKDIPPAGGRPQSSVGSGKPGTVLPGPKLVPSK